MAPDHESNRAMSGPETYGSELAEPARRVNPPSRFWGPWATLGFGAAVIVVSVIVQAIITVIFVIVELAPTLREDLDIFDYSELLERIDMGLLISLSIIISAIICLGLIYLFIKAKRGAVFIEYVGFRRPGIKAVLVVLAVMVGFIVLSALVNYALDISAETDVMTEAYLTSVWPGLFWIAAVVFAPVFEEVFFRGFLFEGFRNSKMGAIGAILLTSLFWSVSHLQYNLFQIASIFVMGIIFGIARHKTGTIWAPLIMHVFNNLLAVLLISIDFGM